MPSLGMVMTEGTIASWIAADGAAVSHGDPIVEIETDKLTHQIEAPAAGVVKRMAEEGQVLPVEGLIAWVLSPGEAVPAETGAAPPAASKVSVELPPRQELDGTPSEPLSLGWPAPSVPLAPRPALLTRSRPASQRYAVRHDEGPRRTPLTGMRQAIAERMTASLATGAQLTLSREVDAEALVTAREARKTSFGSLAYDVFLVKALAAALTEDPTLNAAVEDSPADGTVIVVYPHVSVGVAVALNDGLIVPVLREVSNCSLADLSNSLADLTARARNGRLSPDDLAGGTVTLTNLGAYGVDVFTPILNPPQSAILGVGRIAPRAVAVGGKALSVRPTVHLSLTFDHRVADGVQAAELLDRVARLLGDATWLAAQ